MAIMGVTSLLCRGKTTNPARKAGRDLSFATRVRHDERCASVCVRDGGCLSVRCQFAILGGSHTTARGRIPFRFNHATGPARPHHIVACPRCSLFARPALLQTPSGPWPSFLGLPVAFEYLGPVRMARNHHLGFFVARPLRCSLLRAPE